jgi:hypothetical protein
MVGRGLLQVAAQVKLDVLSAVHFTAEAWGLVTPTAVKNYSVKCGFSTDHVSSNDGSSVKLTEDEDDDWHSLQSLGVQFEDCTTGGSDLEVFGGIQSVCQVSDQHLTKPEGEEEVAEHKATYLGALKVLEAARRCMCQFDTENSIIVTSNRVENGLCGL